MNRLIFVLLIVCCVSYSLLAQNVGIGTTTPSESLHVIGTGVFENPGVSTGEVRMWGPGGHPGITMYSNDPSNYRADIQRGVNGLYFRVHADTPYPPASVIINNNGFVGIGTITPNVPLFVEGAATFNDPGSSTGLVSIGSPGNSPGISIRSNDPDLFRADIQRGTTGLNFRVHDNTTYPPSRMTIKNDGLVGIGTASPAALLSVADGTQLGGTAASTTFRTNSGALSSTWLEETALASFGIKSGGNNVSLGIRALRSTTNQNWHGTALGIGFDVDNTVRAGGGIWITEGKVGINTLNMPGPYSLYVPNGILTERVKVAAANSPEWADYVFDQSYDLKSLTDVEQFIEVNKHLPNIPSAKEIKEKGYEMTEMNVLFMEKIEELFLHTIQQQKEIEELKKANEELREKIK